MTPGNYPTSQGSNCLVYKIRILLCQLGRAFVRITQNNSTWDPAMAADCVRVKDSRDYRVDRLPVPGLWDLTPASGPCAHKTPRRVPRSQPRTKQLAYSFKCRFQCDSPAPLWSLGWALIIAVPLSQGWSSCQEAQLMVPAVCPCAPVSPAL